MKTVIETQHLAYNASPRNDLCNGRTVVMAFSHQRGVPFSYNSTSLFCPGFDLPSYFLFLMSICLSCPLHSSPSSSLAVTCGAKVDYLIGIYEDIKPYQQTTAIKTVAEAGYCTKYKDY